MIVKAHSGTARNADGGMNFAERQGRFESSVWGAIVSNMTTSSERVLIFDAHETVGRTINPSDSLTRRRSGVSSVIADADCQRACRSQGAGGEIR